ncbi:MAG: tetratricopeptide repeat protein [Chloroflexota bacterium]|nr:tetratricopeptide repeat protein [Chloroflexota bacterium]
MVSRTIRHQPYWDQDENYAPLLDFARRYALLLVSGFSAPEESNSEWRHVRLDVDGEQGWQYGTDSGFKVTLWWELQPRYDEVTVDGLSVEAFGMPEGADMKLTTERRSGEDRYIELEVSGPEEGVEAIVRAFGPELAQRYQRTDEQLDAELASALSCLANGDWKGAHIRVLTVLKYRLEDPEVHRLLGLAEAHLGDWQGAKIWLQKALAATSPDAETLYHLGRAYQELGEPERAANTFRQVLQLSPEHGPAREALAGLP